MNENEDMVGKALAEVDRAEAELHGNWSRGTEAAFDDALLALARAVRESRKDCDAEVRHGPGHQSRTKCELKGPHEVHRAVYMGTEATWRGPYEYTGAFDEPPMAD